MGFEVERLLNWRSGVGWFQKRYIEYRVYSGVLWQIKLEVLRALDFLNKKRSDFDIVEFLAWYSRLKIFRKKVYLIPLL